MSSHLSHDSERTPAADVSVHDEAVLGAPTALWGTLAQEKSQTQRSSSASSSQEPPKVRQRSCSQLSTPDPDAPEPHSAGNTHTHAQREDTPSSRRQRKPTRRDVFQPKYRAEARENFSV